MLPPAAERVKEKRVGFPHDLVTVIREPGRVGVLCQSLEETPPGR